MLLNKDRWKIRASMNDSKLYLFVLLGFCLSACGSHSMRGEEIDSEPVEIEVRDDLLAPAAQDRSKWVIEGEMSLSVDSVPKVLSLIHKRLTGIGDVIRQDINKDQVYSSAKLTIRVNPKSLPALLQWLREKGQVTHELVSREEVSRQLLAQNVEMSNAQKMLERLKVFIDKDTLSVNEVLKVERELSRLRELIEKTSRERELLKSRVAFATLHVNISEKPKRLPTAPKAKFYLSGRPNILLNSDSGSEIGWGISLFNPTDPASFHLDFDHFQESDRSLFSLNSASYSDFFGAGQNHFLNPHIGFKVGYGHDRGHHFLFGGSLGLELVRFKYAFVNLKGEGIGLIGKGGLKWLMVGGLDLAVVY